MEILLDPITAYPGSNLVDPNQRRSLRTGDRWMGWIRWQMVLQPASHHTGMATNAPVPIQEDSPLHQSCSTLDTLHSRALKLTEPMAGS
jgi:hypothetical protein